MSELERYAIELKKSLHKSVHDALERKKKLGQYAVVWKEGKVVRILESTNRQYINK